MIELDVTVVAFIVGTVMPLLTAVLTKLSASSGIKAIVNLALSAGAGVLALFTASGGKTTWYEIVGAVVAAYLASGVSYQNLWKPLKVAPALQESTQGFGVG